MKPKLKLLLPLLALSLGLVFTACTSPQKTAVNTLATIGQAGNSAYDAYLSQVLAGTVPTNDVPKVTQLYREFQASFGAAAAAAHFATNTSLATPELLDIAASLTTAIDTIERGGK